MNRIDVIKRIDQETKEKMELARKLDNYQGGCSHQYEEYTNDLVNQIITKNNNLKYLYSLIYDSKPDRLNVVEGLLISVLIVSIIVIILTK